MSTAAAGLLGGWLVDRTVGDPRPAHPVAAFGRLADRVEQRCWRDDRAAGVAYVTLLVGAPTAIAWTLQRALRQRPVAAWALLAAAVATSTGARTLAGEARVVANAVEDGDLLTARARLPALCGRDPADLDAAGLCRAATESLAENTADAVVGPVWWAAVAGVPGVVAHRCANTLDAMVGHHSRRHTRFGWAAARLDDAVGWLPARLTASLTVAAAPLVGGRPRGAANVWRRHGRRHASPNAGVCEAAFAGALGVRLGGEHRYTDADARPRRSSTGPFGSADAPSPTPHDVQRAAQLSTAVGLAAALLAASVRLAYGLRSDLKGKSGAEQAIRQPWCRSRRHG